MIQKRQKIPLLLKLKRFKGSKGVRSVNSFISKVKPSAKYPGIPKKILLFRNDRIGDAMVTLPVIRDIKANYPDAEIDVIVSSRNEFIFKDFAYADNIVNLKISGTETGLIYKLPLFGGFLLFMKYLFLPVLFSAEFRKKLVMLMKRQYDYAADLVGLKRNAIIARTVSGFTAGPGRLLPFLFYDYYSATNWVSQGDMDFMTKKIESFIVDSAGIIFTKCNTEMPLMSTAFKSGINYDVIFHFGTSKLRKLDYEKEKEIIDQFSGFNILVTDSKESPAYKRLKNEFSGNKNITFSLYGSLTELAKDCCSSNLLVCYDGGQAHYLGQYIRTVTIFGPGSPFLWRPYEFASYIHLNSGLNEQTAVISEGVKKHIAFFRPIWCNPCFDTGCKTRPCLDLTVSFIIKTIKENLQQSAR
jgi:ADP-heptose:LPS heptosyltransferase